MLNVCVCRGDAGERCSACGLLVTTPPKLPGLKEAWPEEKKIRNPMRRTKKKSIAQESCPPKSVRAALWRLTYHMQTPRSRVWSGSLAPQFRLR